MCILLGSVVLDFDCISYNIKVNTNMYCYNKKNININNQISTDENTLNQIYNARSKFSSSLIFKIYVFHPQENLSTPTYTMGGGNIKYLSHFFVCMLKFLMQ